MHLLRRDIIATAAVAVAGILYVLWAMDATLPGMSGTRATGTAILALGFAASAIAVVPGFDELIRGDRAYLIATSVIGLGALVAAIHMLVTGSSVTLAILMVVMVVLWLAATVHHNVLARTASGGGRPHHSGRWGQPHGA